VKSTTFKVILNPKTLMWSESTLYVYDEYCSEMKRKKVENNKMAEDTADEISISKTEYEKLLKYKKSNEISVTLEGNSLFYIAQNPYKWKYKKPFLNGFPSRDNSTSHWFEKLLMLQQIIQIDKIKKPKNKVYRKKESRTVY
jgi:hypothetical protein